MYNNRFVIAPDEDKIEAVGEPVQTPEYPRGASINLLGICASNEQACYPGARPAGFGNPALAKCRAVSGPASESFGCDGPRQEGDVTLAAVTGQIVECDSGVDPATNRSQFLNPGDEELVALARRGDRRAFEDLVDRHKEKAYRIAFDFTRDREDAKDLSQDAFLKAFTHLTSFDGRSTFYTWFYRILVNLCLDYKRRQKRTAADTFDETEEKNIEPSHQPAKPPAPDQEVSARQLSFRVGQALDNLPARQRTAFVLKNHQGLSIKEIAELMETAEGTVKVHLHRAVTTLRERLAEFV